MKRPASLSLDLDNKWSYLKTYGSEAWRDYPSYLDSAVPRILGFLNEQGVRITFFIVGQDAALAKNRSALRSIADAGHEIGNHSFKHEPWLHLYDDDQIEADLVGAEEAILEATGIRVDGFRGPGFSMSRSVLNILKRRGYRYDATSFPNILNPLARAYFFAKSSLTDEEKEQRKALFGSYSDAFRPVRPYRWSLDDGELIELPVTTMPFFKVPIHFSYLLYLARYSRLLARAYFRFFLFLCSLSRTEPSLLMHPLDFLGRDDDRELAFFPGMDMPSAVKLDVMRDMFGILLAKYRPVTVGEHSDLLRQRDALSLRQPTFSA
jgi:peptidoglycan/xylan/chitin deacetylase (PgdA/CDA1 family)